MDYIADAEMYKKNAFNIKNILQEILFGFGITMHEKPIPADTISAAAASMSSSSHPSDQEVMRDRKSSCRERVSVLV